MNVGIIIFIVVVGFILYKGYKMITDKGTPSTGGSGGGTGGGGGLGDSDRDEDHIDHPSEEDIGREA